ncbi:glycerol-3-phosphate dehydrogenase/oxidase [Mobiluncus curtisii]|uniref:glycerol-3-phosphate dehydrogenase/oxidase n=1 Tax=Mobiluncus curtisii TaxID=2051 RepID=UPI0014707957|nr:glycerol-3-phosphate dehydrogenase/oxidase [Mobiluncus curtisii]NMW88483.1 glycerol-3-phosphate dehydrogenase/oxidase [Mobiluncus curtisii]
MKFSAALNASRRRNDLDEVMNANEPVDLVIIGGGITGVGTALDAVTRGLNTVLIEKHDLGFGTSRWSSKLAHGGLRYLAKMDLQIAHNSAVERGILMTRTAPHLIHSLPQVTALGADTNLFQKSAMRLGFIAGDLLRISAGTSSRVLPHSHYASPKQTLALCPAVSRDRLRGAWVNYDGQMVDDARIVSAIARTAAGYGAKILTRVEALRMSAHEVQVRDTVRGQTGVIPARAVINATGVWAAGLDTDIHIRPSRGTHLIFSAERLGNPRGSLTVPLPGSISRYLFILPAPHHRVYLGLTDEDNPGPIPDVPETPDADIDFLLRNINLVLEQPLSRDDVIGTFTGLRPLIDSGEGGATADVSRKHALIRSCEGAFSVVGGKYTEYRLMAEQCLDRVLAASGVRAGACRTRDLPIIGAHRHPDFRGVSRDALVGLPKPLVRRFGREAPLVAQAEVARPLEYLDGTDVTRAEVAFALTHEGAMNVADILQRRTRLGLVKDDASRVDAEVQEIIAEIAEKGNYDVIA